MISRYVDYDVVCDGCGVSYGGVAPSQWDSTKSLTEPARDTSTVSARVQRARARTDGWRRRLGEDLCPNCQRGQRVDK